MNNLKLFKTGEVTNMCCHRVRIKNELHQIQRRQYVRQFVIEEWVDKIVKYYGLLPDNIRR